MSVKHLLQNLAALLITMLRVSVAVASALGAHELLQSGNITLGLATYAITFVFAGACVPVLVVIGLLVEQRHSLLEMQREQARQVPHP